MTRLLELNEELVDAIARNSGAVSAEAAVEDILRKHLATQAQGRLRAMFGTVEFDPEYDLHAMRANRFPETGL